MNYKIFKVFTINYSAVLNNLKKDYFFLNYRDHLKKYLNSFFIETPGFSEIMISKGNMSYDIIYNYYELQKKWANENKKKIKEKISLKEYYFQVFEKQIELYKPDVIFFRTEPPFDSNEIFYLKKKFPFLKKIVCHNGFISNNLKNVDILFTSSPGLQKFYNNKGLNSDLLYHSFDKSILLHVKKRDKKNKIFFAGQTGHIDDVNYSLRFEYLYKLFKGKFNVKCHSIESSIKELNMIYENNSLRQKIRNNLLTIFKNNKILTKLSQSISIKNITLNNFIKDLNYLRNRKKYLHEIYPSLILKPIFGKKLFNEIHNSEICLNFHTNVSKNYCGNYRMFESTGLKSCLITEEKDNIKDLYEPDHEVVTYKSYDELENKLKDLMTNQKLREQIAINGYKRTLKDHTLQKRLDFLNEKIIKSFI